MNITRVVVKNYRCLSDAYIELKPGLNIIVGDNECGKSTFLEAVNLALSGQLNGRSIQSELHPPLFNKAAVTNYIASLRNGSPVPPPSIMIEVYFVEDSTLSTLQGTNNSKKQDVPGVKLLIEFNEDFNAEYKTYIENPQEVDTVPVEYYAVRWRSFADNEITVRSIPVKGCLIDASAIRNNLAASRYMLEIVKSKLSKKDQAELAIAYRSMKSQFLNNPRVEEINLKLTTDKGIISEKALSLSLDASSRTNWESGITPHLDDIPMPLVGKGEQNKVNIKVAMQSNPDSHVVLIEEPENHLSFSNLNVLINQISARRGDRQLIITTHSSFVLNKLGLDSVQLFRNGTTATLTSLDADTQNYFLKLPGYDTLRLILSARAILVEGASDELIVQKAFKMRHAKMPIESGVDVITVSSLAFKRFLKIANLLRIRVDVVTDNDGNVQRLKDKYKDYLNLQHIRIHFDEDARARTLEDQLLKANGREPINTILGRQFGTDDELLTYMKDNKTDCALRFFETRNAWNVPEYIKRAISE
jgi:putative ATP-dependent endonuclease of OLD family